LQKRQLAEKTPHGLLAAKLLAPDEELPEIVLSPSLE
jgi:hypothetical protein